MMVHCTSNAEDKYGKIIGIDTSAFTAGQIVHLGLDGQIISNPYVELDAGCYHVVCGVIDVVDDIDGIITVDTRADSFTMEVTDTNGFPPDQADKVDLSYVNATRTFTVTSIAQYHYYVQGDKHVQDAI